MYFISTWLSDLLIFCSTPNQEMWAFLISPCNISIEKFRKLINKTRSRVIVRDDGSKTKSGVESDCGGGVASARRSLFSLGARQVPQEKNVLPFF